MDAGIVSRVRSLLGQAAPRRERRAELPGDLPPPAWVIAGLGNPGPKYRQTRHNVGFLCLDRLAERTGIRFDRVRHTADLGVGQIAGQTVWLVKPRTYMNASGRAIGPLLREAGCPIERLLVVYDELDLGLGTVRLRKSGSSGGHNGMKSIIDAVGSSEFPRLRVGVGRPAGAGDPIEYLLSEFGPDEWPVVEEVRDRVAEAIPVALEDGLDAAMNRFNRRA